MNFKQLQYFVATAKLGSITAAARELDVAQPSISQQLANLEYELKNALFERNHKGVQLTESGQLFFTHATELLNQMIHAKTAIADLAKYPCGSVSLGVTQDIGNIIAIPLIESISESYPGINVQITTLPSQILNKALELREIDIALSYKEEAPAANVVCKPLMKEDLYIAVGKQGKCTTFRKLLSLDVLTFDAICDLEVMTPGHNESLYDVLKSMEDRFNKKLKLQAGFGQLSVALRAVTEGKSIMIAPSSATYHLADERLIKLIPLRDNELKLEVTINTHAESTISKAMSLVIDKVIETSWNAHKTGAWAGEFIYTAPKKTYPPKSNVNYIVAEC